MRLIALSFLMPVVLVACASTEGGVVNKVLSDFGLKTRSEEYTTGTQNVFNALPAVAATEMKRLNVAEQHGRVKFQQDGELRGKYYKEVKIYETYFPTDARPISASSGAAGYYGFIDYQYRIYQSIRTDTATAAEAETADVPTDQTGRESYRYTFSQSGAWDGAKGDKVRS